MKYNISHQIYLPPKIANYINTIVHASQHTKVARTSINSNFNF